MSNKIRQYPVVPSGLDQKLTDYLFTLTKILQDNEYEKNREIATSYIRAGKYPDGYTEITKDGNLQMIGDSTVWEDLRFPATAINPAGAPSPMTFDTTNIGFTAPASGTSVIAIIAQLPHSWKEGSSIEPHIHWMPMTTNVGGVYWQMDYKWTSTGGVESNTFTTVFKVDSSGGTAKKSLITSLGLISGAGHTISSILSIKISRIGGDTLDTFTGDALLKEFDIHYEIDTLGSKEIYSK